MLYQMTRFLLSCLMTIGYPDGIVTRAFSKHVFRSVDGVNELISHLYCICLERGR